MIELEYARGARLKGKPREAYLLHAAGKSPAEIAEILNIKPAYAQNALQRARNAVYAWLECRAQNAPDGHSAQPQSTCEHPDGTVRDEALVLFESYRNSRGGSAGGVTPTEGDRDAVTARVVTVDDFIPLVVARRERNS